MMSFALGGLGWQPSEFWRAVPHDLVAAAEWNERENARAKREAADRR